MSLRDKKQLKEAQHYAGGNSCSGGNRLHGPPVFIKMMTHTTRAVVPAKHPTGPGPWTDQAAANISRPRDPYPSRPLRASEVTVERSPLCHPSTLCFLCVPWLSRLRLSDPAGRCSRLESGDQGLDLGSTLISCWALSKSLNVSEPLTSF